jgi:ABC-type branched-subunit amino acid transport system substrate-binding protein
MNRSIFIFLFTCILIKSNAQLSTEKQMYRIGIFTSLYLDSAYKDNKYQFENAIPKYILRGLDFAIGARLAIDTLEKKDSFLIHYTIFDIQSKSQKIQKLQADRVFDSLDLIIGNVSGADFKAIASITCAKQIPFVSVTYPNDAGVTNCPTTIIINPTIQVHCETIFNYILENEPVANMIYLSKTGQQEMKIKGFYDKLNIGIGKATLLPWKEYIVTDTSGLIDEKKLEKLLDSTRKNIIIGGTLDEKYSGTIIKTAANLKKYNISLFGMPSWETIPEISIKDFEHLTIYYSTSFYNTNQKESKIIDEKFAKRTNAKPSDIAYKAYESTLYFTRLLRQYGRSFTSNLKGPETGVFTQYRIQPVYNQSSSGISYLENKKLYIISLEKGIKKEISKK